jgi:ABC-type lipoprotein export system ATPase subunit
MDGQKQIRELTDNQRQSIQDLLRSFEGDATKAVYGLREYMANDRRKASLVKQPIRRSEEVIISVKNVKKSYKIGRQKVEAVNDVSLSIHKGEFIALTGASGSGKSTLLQLIGGLDKPTDGEITVNGTNLGKMNDRKLSKFRNQTIGFVFQFFYLQPFLRVQKNIEVPAMFAGTKRSDRQPLVEKISKSVGLSDRLTHLPKELSGGQMQRVAIARALLNNPKILLADEPTGNLDSSNSEAIIELFEKVRDEFGTTIIIVTHDPAIARRADREIKLKDGKIL